MEKTQKTTAQEKAELQAWLAETKDEPLETMAGFFDARIGEYEAHMACWSRQYQWMAELIPETVTELLDIGCGSGLELDRIFERMPQVRVTGIDLSSEMLSALQRKHGDKKLTLMQDDYFLHDFGKNRFDCVISFETLHHVDAEKKTALFRKIYDSLKPDGLYLECDYIAASQEMEDLVFSECARRRKRDQIPDGAFVHFDTPLTLAHEKNAMQAAGFGKVECIGFLPGDSHTPMLRATKKG